MSRKGENIRRRKDGRWEARCLVTKVSTGKKKYIYLYAKSYAEVREKNTADQLSGSQKIIRGRQTVRTGIIEWNILWINGTREQSQG